MSKDKQKSKRGSKITKRKPDFTEKKLKEANERAAALVPDHSDPNDDGPRFDVAPPGMAWLSGKMSKDQKKILSGILCDMYPDNEEETRPAVYRKLHAAAKRMGFLGSHGDELRFFRTLADPDFNEITKVVGRGLVGLEVLEVLDTAIEQAKNGCLTSQKRIFEIAGLLDSKYDYYKNQYNLTHNGPIAGDVNIGEKTDKELAVIANSFSDVTEEAEIIS